jgi:hypothetical protein
MSLKPRPLMRIEYEKAAEAYLHSLPPEHFMEEITVESLALVRALDETRRQQRETQELLRRSEENLEQQRAITARQEQELERMRAQLRALGIEPPP